MRKLCFGVAALLAGCASQGSPLLTAGGPEGLSGLARARQAIGALAPAMAQPTTFNNRLAVYPDRTAFPVVESMLQGASRSLFVETFELHDDPSGKRVLDILIAKHQAGVPVRVILDETGNRHVKSTAVKNLEKAGVPVLYYGPYPFFNSHGPGLNITHRKLYLVDGDQAMTGGMNVGDKYFLQAHDMLWKVEGEAAFALHKEFENEWRRSGGKTALPMPPAPMASYGQEPIGIAVTSPRESGRVDEIRKVVFQAIDGAKTRIDTAYPFFFDDTMVAKLSLAARRGVQVHVVLTTHDRESMHKLNLYTARQAMPKGVQFHWWTDSYAHIKYCAVDDAFLAVGSSNADSLTFDNNQELDLVLTNPSTVAAFRKQVTDPDWAATPAVTSKDTAIAPIARPIYTLLELIDAYM